LATAKEAAFSAADAALQSMSDAGLEHHASRVADTLKTVTEDVVTTAFEPSASEPADDSSDIKQRQP
jgi:hypothetical protein